MIKIDNVLVPVDGSKHSLNAVVYAANLLNTHNAKLYLLHVMKELPRTIGGEESKDLHEEETAKALQMLRGYLPLIADVNPQVELLVRFGRPDYQILNVQEEFDCDMIVIGSRGHSELENLIMGSVVTRVLQGSTCPVLVTRNLKAKYLK